MSYHFGNNLYRNGESSTSSSSTSFYDTSTEDKMDFSYLDNNLRELQSIVGPGVSLPDLENLWNASNGNMQAAVNNYFDGNMDKENLAITTSIPLRRSTNSNYYSSDNEQPRKKPRKYVTRDWVRRCLGSIVVPGQSSIKGEHVINIKDKITFESQINFQKPIRGRKRQKNQSCWQNTILKFKTANGAQLGIVSDHRISFMISNLIDAGVCEFEGQILPIGNNVNYNGKIDFSDEIFLDVKVYILRAAFSREPIFTISRENTKAIATGNASVAEHKSNDRKNAILSMLEQCGIHAKQSSGLIQEHKHAGTLNAEKMEEHFENEEWTGFKSASSIHQSLFGPPNDPNDEEGQSISDKQLNALYEKAQMLDLNIPEAEPPAHTFLYNLRRYQKQALHWMLSKETLDPDQTKPTSLHPLWEEYEFPDKEIIEDNDNQSNKLFYFNPYTGELSLEFQKVDQCRGGILADEMGLGKTIEILSLIHAVKYPTFDPNQFDSDVIDLTVDTKPSTSKSIFRPISSSTYEKYPKINTTLIVCPMSLLSQWRDEVNNVSAHDTLSVEVYYGKKRNWDIRAIRSRKVELPDVLVTTYGVLMSEFNDEEKKPTTSPLFNVEFSRVVLDEAHIIKSRNTKTAKACYALRAGRRWALTGTPIQNRLEDIFSLVHFLRHEPWSNFQFWKKYIQTPFDKKDIRALGVVQGVLEPLVLRRTKNMRDINGQPIIELPKKDVELEYLEFSPEEQDIYDSIYTHSKTKFNYYCQAGSILSHYAHIFQLLVRLRQVCDHPILAISRHTVTSADEDGINDSAFDEEGNLNIDRLIERFMTNYGERDNSANYQIEMLEKLKYGDDFSNRECPICYDNLVNGVLMPCMHSACRQCIMEYFQSQVLSGKPGQCPVCRRGPISENDLLEINNKRIDNNERNKDKTTSSASNDNETSTDDDSSLKLSAKLGALLHHLNQLRQDNKMTEKCVIFSQFTSMLDLIGEVLTKENFVFVRLDGTQQQSERERVLEDFKKPGIDIILISLRAGGVGLNLTVASRAFLMDPWWNSSIEDQAIDRVHRIGQKREVKVIRFIIKNSIEEKMLSIQRRKNAIACGLGMSKDELKAHRLEDLRELFS